MYADAGRLQQVQYNTDVKDLENMQNMLLGVGLGVACGFSWKVAVAKQDIPLPAGGVLGRDYSISSAAKDVAKEGTRPRQSPPPSSS